ncbi:MAG: adenylate/guanylate cyclase domain-containing protein [Anaerolineae bacterium]
MTAIINRYFNTMLAFLREHCGQLINFGGDALLGLFTEPDSAARALQTALQMQAAMTDFAETETSQGIFPLQMKVGLRQGWFFAAQLGTPQEMEHGFFGADVNATAAAESAAVAGQVLLDRATFQAIGLPVDTHPVPGDDRYLVARQITAAASSPSPPQPARTNLAYPTEPTVKNLRHYITLLDTLTPYLPAGLLARIASDPHAISLEGEHRLVTVLFASVRGLDQIADRLGPGKEDVIVDSLNRYFTAMAEAIHHYDGVINKIDLDEEGNKILAFFGAPQAHEDDPERAARAALEMQASFAKISRILPIDAGLPQLKLTQQIGISLGYVFAGYVGSDWRREYTVMGDEVNLAARLMARCEPGSILVSGNVARKIQALFSVMPHGDVTLKGKSEAVGTFSVEGLRSVPEAQRGLKGMYSPLVGRETEWQHLLSALVELLLGRGQIVSVIGEAGLGKSRLIAEMRHYVVSEGRLAVRWVEGHALSYTETVSYWPFQEIVRQLVGLTLDDDLQASWPKLQTALEDMFPVNQARDILPYLAHFLGLPIEEAFQERLRYLEAEALQRRTFVAISALLERHTTAPPGVEIPPLVLVLEDIHWLDRASQALLKYLMPLVGRVPLMFLFLYRPEREKGCWQIHEKATREFPHCTTQVNLSPLTAAGSHALLTNLVPLKKWSDDIQDLILERAEGNPLYLEEVIRALIDDHVLAQDENGQWRLTGTPETIQVPDTLQGVIMSRLDRLEEPCRWTIQVASVIGRVFSLDMLAHVINVENSDHLNRCLNQLQQQGLIKETQRAPELLFGVKHAMIQEVSYRGLLARQRRLYHRKIARYLEAKLYRGQADVESLYPLIAHHAYQGHDWPRALRFQLLTGRQARQFFANHEAIEHLRRALHSAQQLPPRETAEQQLTIHAGLGELLATTGQYDEAQTHLTAAHDLAVDMNNADAQIRACRWLARLHELRAEYPPALDWIERGLAVLNGRETPETVELLLIAGLIHTRQGDYDQALDCCENGLRIAQKLDAVTVLARAYNLLGVITRQLGHSAIAIEHFQKALSLYHRFGDVHGQATSHNLIATAYMYMG